MKPTASIIILIVASALLSGCANTGGVGDLERWWSGSVGESQKGLTIGDAERAWSRGCGADGLSIEAAERHFAAMTRHTCDATSISALNRSITEDREYQRTLDSFSPAAANRAIDEARGR